MSEEFKGSGLVSAVSEIQHSLKAPKGQTNKFGGYKYRSCEDILEAVKPHLSKHGLILTISDEIVDVAGRVYVKATAAVHNSQGHSVQTSGYAREEEVKKGMDASQITGSASSYARKYALNGLFCIDDTRDSDATNDHGKSAPKQVVKNTGSVVMSDAEMEQLENYIRNSKNRLAAFQAVDEKHGKRMSVEQNDYLKSVC